MGRMTFLRRLAQSIPSIIADYADQFREILQDNGLAKSSAQAL
jgi:hypothetical protein